MMIRNKHQLDEHTMHSVHTQHTTPPPSRQSVGRSQHDTSSRSCHDRRSSWQIQLLSLLSFGCLGCRWHYTQMATVSADLSRLCLYHIGPWRCGLRYNCAWYSRSIRGHPDVLVIRDLRQVVYVMAAIKVPFHLLFALLVCSFEV